MASLRMRSLFLLGGLPAGRKAAWRSFAAAPEAAAVQLYQYEICPFCCKVKAFLDWQKVAYSTIEVNPLTKAELKFADKYRKVPVAMIDGIQTNDSSNILTALASRNRVGANSQTQLAEDLSMEDTGKWLQWADKELAVLLFPNITRSFSESFQAFRYIGEVPTFGVGAKVANQLAGSMAMWLANGKLKKKYGITDERKQLLEALQTWVSAVGQGPFLRGAQLSVPDVVVYGVLSSIRGLQTYHEIMEASPELAKWCGSVRAAIGGSMRQEASASRRKFGPLAE